MVTLSRQVVLGEEWAGQPCMRPPGSAQLTAGNGGGDGGAAGNSSGVDGALATFREGGVTTAGDLSGGKTAPRPGTLICWHRGAMRRGFCLSSGTQIRLKVHEAVAIVASRVDTWHN